MKARTLHFGEIRQPDNDRGERNELIPDLYPVEQYAELTLKQLFSHVCPCKVVNFVFMVVIVYYLAKIANK